MDQYDCTILRSRTVIRHPLDLCVFNVTPLLIKYLEGWIEHLGGNIKHFGGLIEHLKVEIKQLKGDIKHLEGWIE